MCLPLPAAPVARLLAELGWELAPASGLQLRGAGRLYFCPQPWALESHGTLAVPPAPQCPAGPGPGFCQPSWWHCSPEDSPCLALLLKLRRVCQLACLSWHCHFAAGRAAGLHPACLCLWERCAWVLSWVPWLGELRCSSEPGWNTYSNSMPTAGYKDFEAL